jgi:GNAT superfamily N-acetyltransferase
MVEDHELRIRRATASDADAVATVYLRSRRHAVPQIPELQGQDDSVRGWLHGVVVRGDEVWVAETEDKVIVAMMLLEGGWIEQLYVHPSWTGRGLGARLLEVAKRSRPDGLQLWTFQSNRGAHRFYERHGFEAEELTDGSRNQERSPDVRYVWRPVP